MLDRSSAIGPIENAAPRSRRRGRSVRKFLANPLALIGLACIAVFVLMAIFAPWIAPDDPNAIGLGPSLAAPSAGHLAGLDKLGRDVLSRTIYGARLSLLTGIGAVMVAVAIGGSIGLLAGGIGGRVEGALMRVVDVFLAIPSILLAIAIISLVGQGAWQVVVAVGVGYAATYARILRGSLVAVREAEFVAAARSIGAPPSRLILRHMLPNALSPLVVASTLGVATAVLDVAALGFLGLGAADPRIAEWGAMLSDSTELLRRAPYVLLAPGVAIVVSAIGFTLLGDGLREALDPRAR